MSSLKTSSFVSRTRNWIEEMGIPFKDYRFWIIQTLVLAIDVSHFLLEKSGLLVTDSELYILSVSPFLLPVVYAALNFGHKGAAPTFAWALLLWLPEIISHQSNTRLGIIIQFGIIGVIAMIVANRVERENLAAGQAREANVRLLKAKENLEIYIGLATEAQEKERKRLSRELHDDTLQSLATAITEIGMVTTSESLVGAENRLLRVQEILSSTMASVRRFCRDLRPSLLDDLGLIDAIEWLVSDLQSRSGILVTLEVRGERQRLDERLELPIFRVVQEALHNVEHHARATQVDVGINFDHGSLVVSIADNGRGMSSLGPPTETGLGLRGMDERTKLLKGSLIIESKPRRGTKITLVVPFP
ncbi:MAG: sensor histidine kinase [Candidatus Nanopelagicaceae bacterium]|nr:sensor histidine kinase [Candidatus Nanopelagicaceae bacterium]